MDEYITVFTDMYGISEDDRGKPKGVLKAQSNISRIIATLTVFPMI